MVGTTVIVQAGYDGEWVGRLDVAFDGQGRAVEPQVEIITLGAEVADDPVMAALVDSYKERFPTSTQGD
jgi:2',3'-cyclic-nucleotide 2'-phosphodiesterase (5'-nucleotidase family)